MSTILSEADYLVGITEDKPFTGKVVIFSFEYFDKIEVPSLEVEESNFVLPSQSEEKMSQNIYRRVGAEKDLKDLNLMFSQLCFQVTIESNKSDVEMREIICRISKETHLSLFICVVLSHGHSDTKFKTSNNMDMCIKIDIMNELEKSHNLKDTVKIYIGNFCRSDGSEAFVNSDSSQHLDAQPNSIIKNNNNVNLTKSILVFSTLPGTLSYRSPTVGSQFIQVFVRLIKEKHRTHDLFSLLELTNMELQTNPFSFVDDENNLIICQQALHYESFNLTRKILLFPTVL